MHRFLKIFFLFIYLCSSGYLFAQADSALLVSIENYKVTQLENGMRVIIVNTNRFDHVFYRLTFDFQPVNDKYSTGAFDILTMLMGCEKISETQIVKDMVSHERAVDSLLQFMSNVVLTPDLNADKITKIKKRMEGNIVSVEDIPDTMVARYGRALVFGKNHPFSFFPTLETNQKITPEIIKTQHSLYLQPNKTILTIVGNVNQTDVIPFVNRYFGSWKNNQTPPPPAKVEKSPGGVYVYNLPQSSITNVFVAYPLEYYPDKDNFINTQILINLFGNPTSGKLRKVLADEKNYTSDISAFLVQEDIGASFLSRFTVNTENTENAVKEFITQMTDLRTIALDLPTIQPVINQLTDDFAASFERPVNVANYAWILEKYKFPKNYFSNYLTNLKKAKPIDIQNLAKKILKPDEVIITLLGNTPELLCQLISLATVQTINIQNQKSETVTKFKKGFGANTILNDYVKSLTNNHDINDITVNFDAVYTIADTMKITMEGLVLHKLPDMYFRQTKIRHSKDTLLFHHVEMFDGEFGWDSSLVELKKCEGFDLLKLRYKTFLFPELEYNSLDVKYQLNCDTALFNNGLYQIQLDLPWGDRFLDYYEIKTGYKIKTEVLTDEGSGFVIKEIIEYSDFKPVSDDKDIIMPYKETHTINNTNILYTIKSIDTKTNLKKSYFQMERK